MKPCAPACERNQPYILEVLKRIFVRPGNVLEIGSGTGQHAVYFASRLPHLEWQPTDLAGNLDGIEAWRRGAGLPNVRKAGVLDLASPGEPPVRPDYVVCINTIHIVPWPLVESLFALAGDLLQSGDLIYTYGPYRFADRPLEASNREFDLVLRARGTGSGIRLFEDVDDLASRHGFRHEGDEPMPANNRSLWWRRI
jgi:hypothetical protein